MSAVIKSGFEWFVGKINTKLATDHYTVARQSFDEEKYQDAYNEMKQSFQYDFNTNLKQRGCFFVYDVLFKMDKFQEMETFSLKLLSTDPNCEGYQSMYICLLLENDKMEETKAKVLQFLIKSPECDTLNMFYGRILYDEGNYKEAESHLKKCIQMKHDDEFNGTFYYLYALSLRQMGRYEEAEKQCHIALSKEPNCEIYQSNYIDLLMKSDKMEEAKVKVLQFLSKSPECDTLHALYGSLLHKNECYEESARSYKRAAEINPEVMRYHVKYIEELSNSKQWDKVQNVSDRLFSEHKDNEELHLLYADAMADQYNYDSAIHHYQKAIEINPTNTDAISSCAHTFCKMNQIKKAKDLIRPLLDGNSDDLRYNYRYAWILKENGEYKECEPYLQKCIKLDKNKMDARIYMAYGHLCYLTKRLDDAESYFQLSLKIDEENEYTYHFYALTLLHLGRIEESIIKFKKSLSLHHYKSRYAEGHYDFGVMLFEKLNKYQEGIGHISKAVEIVPNNALYSSTLKKFHQRMTELNETVNKDSEQKYEEKEMTDVHRKCNILMEENSKLKKEKEHLNVEFNEMKQTYSHLRLKLSDYQTWDYNDITEWIMRIDKEYVRYENVLRNALKEEEMDGSDLVHLDKNDLARFGIKKFKHKMRIMDEIKRLKTNDNEGNAEMDESGATAYI